MPRRSPDCQAFSKANEFNMIKGNRSFVQRKKTKAGVVRQFNDLVFSRRLGSTLEMRGFAGNGLFNI
jgi:hypothetical protein